MTETKSVEKTGVENVRFDLERLPELILEKSTELYGSRTTYDEFKLRLKAIELNVETTVADETVDGKKTYPNALARSAEVQRRLKQHSEYDLVKTSVDVERKRIDQLSLTIAFMRDKLGAARALARLIAGTD